MAKKKAPLNTFCEAYMLPSNDSDLFTFIEKFRLDMSEQVVSSIDYAIRNNLPMVEIFQFKNSEFVVTISKPHFKEHLDHIFNYYMESEYYELCSRVTQVRDKLNQIDTNETKKIKRDKRVTISTDNGDEKG
jgi:hypothetical protein